MNLLKLWRLWRTFEEVKDMDKKALLKLAVAVVLAVGSSAGTAFLSDNPVSFAALANTALVAVFAYLKASPLAPKE